MTAQAASMPRASRAPDEAIRLARHVRSRPCRKLAVLIINSGERSAMASGAAAAGCTAFEAPWWDVSASGEGLHLGTATLCDSRGGRHVLTGLDVVPDVVIAGSGALAAAARKLSPWAATATAWFITPAAAKLAHPAPPGPGGAAQCAWVAVLPGSHRGEVIARTPPEAGAVPGTDVLGAATARALALLAEAARALDCGVPLASPGSWLALARVDLGPGGADLTSGPAALDTGRDRLAEQAARRLFERIMAAADVRTGLLNLPVLAAGESAMPAPSPQEGDELPGAPHPLAPLLPTLAGETGIVGTVAVPGGRLAWLDERLMPSGAAADRVAALTELLVRTTVPPGEETSGAVLRYVEPGVGRSCLLDGLHVDGRPDLADFSATGVGLTPYSWGGFVDLGTPITGRAALVRAEHRRSCADRLEQAGCPAAPVLAIAVLPAEHITMPDGSLSPAAVVVRGFRCVLRVKQLDPVAGFYHSIQHAPLVAEAVLQAAGTAIRPAEVADVLLALDYYSAAPDDVRRLVLGPAAAGPWQQARAVRLSLVHAHAPVLLELARRRLGRRLGAELTLPDYAEWFATSLGRTLARWRALRFLHDYHQPGVGRSAPTSTLVENNVTLLGEFPDLDTGLFVDDPPDRVAAEIQLPSGDLALLRRGFAEFHLREVAATRAIAGTFAAIALPGRPRSANQAMDGFDAAYARERRCLG